jgi:Ssp1 endopeptidase immunity protein Rap1a
MRDATKLPYRPAFLFYCCFRWRQNMRLALAALLLIVAGFFANTAKADPLTVGQLAARCGKLDMSEYNAIKLRSVSIGDALDGGKCWGHLEAYIDLASIELPGANKENPIHPLDACPPYKNNITFTELAQLFLQYASSHPADLQKPAALIAANILAEKFPCRK